MNPMSHRLEASEDPVPPEKKGWRRFDVGHIVECQGHKFKVIAVDIAKQTIKLKVVNTP
jgi:hypothetical protein